MHHELRSLGKKIPTIPGGLIKVIAFAKCGHFFSEDQIRYSADKHLTNESKILI